MTEPEPARYSVILADPPWRYQHVRTKTRAIENHYPTMTLEDICALPVAGIATPDCVLFLWTTAPKMEEAMAVIRAWGFTYRSGAVWDKRSIGMGYYFRIEHEHLLVATRGKPGTPPTSARFPSVIQAPRGKHSKKPEIVAGMIERMYPDARRVELFARDRRPGWDAWGNEVASDLTLGAA